MNPLGMDPQMIRMLLLQMMGGEQMMMPQMAAEPTGLITPQPSPSHMLSTSAPHMATVSGGGGMAAPVMSGSVSPSRQLGNQRFPSGRRDLSLYDRQGRDPQHKLDPFLNSSF